MSLHQGIKYTIRILVGVLAGLYLGISLLLHVPAVQRRISAVAADELSSLLQSEVKIGRVELGLFNRIILEDVHLSDRQREEMLRVARLSAKFELLPLLQQRIVVHSVQLFGFQARLYKEAPEAEANFQFVLDAFASKDTVKSEFPVDVRINSILIRRGGIHYDVRSLPVDSGRFDLNHLHVNRLSATLSLKACSADSLNATVKNLHLEEGSGLTLDRLALKLTAGPQRLLLQDFRLALPHTTLQMDSLVATYDSLAQLKAFTADVNHRGSLTGQVVLKDIAPLVPALRGFNFPLALDLSWTGEGTSIDLDPLSITYGPHLTLHGEAGIGHDGTDTFVYGRVKNLYADTEGLTLVAQSLGEQKAGETLNSLGYIHLTGDYEGRTDAVHINSHLRTEVGEAETQLTMQRDESGRSYSGHIVGSGVDLGRILNQSDTFGATDFDLELRGFNYRNNRPETYVKGEISSFVYKDYPYQHISLDGDFREGGFNGRVELDDDNGTISLDGQFNTSGKVKTFNLQAEVENLRPHDLNWTSSYPDAAFTGRLTADFRGSSVDDMEGAITLDDLRLDGPTEEESYTLSRLTLTAGRTADDEREVTLKAPFLTASLRGHYAYHTVPASLLRTAQQYIPALVTVNQGTPKPDNVFHFDVRIEPDPCFERLLHLPLHLDMPLALTGSVDDRAETFRLEGSFPDMTYNGTHYHGAVLQCDTPADQLRAYFRTGILLGSGAMLNVALNAQAKDDVLQTSLDWGNNTEVTYGGKVAATTRFTKTEGAHPRLRTDIEVLPTQVVLNDSVWHIHSSHVAVDSGRVSVDRFLFEHADQHLLIDGTFGNRPQDECLVDLKKLDIQYILDIVHFDDVAFGGLATGKASLRSVIKDPEIQVDLDVDRFAVNDGLMGRALIHGDWDKALGGIRLKADIKEEAVTEGLWKGAGSRTQVDGYVSFKEKGLDLHIDADRTNLALLEPFLEGIFSRIDGRANGNIRLYGDFKHLDLEGEVRASVKAHLDVLHTDFIVRDDSVHISSGQLLFNRVGVFDPEGNAGYVTGYLRHTKLKNLNYHFGIDGQNFLMYDTREPDDMPFYGRVYATGHVDLDGGWNAMNVNAAFTTGRHTTFTYMNDYAPEALSNQFITFVDRTPGRIHNAQALELPTRKEEQPKVEDEPAMDLNIHMQIDATPEATMRIMMDPVAGDNITATGRGNLQVSYYNKGDFRIFGNYYIDSGKYKLSMQEVIRKDFLLQSGGTVSFNGDPYEADLDVQAVYTVNSASMSDLGVDTSQGGQSTVKVNCLMNLTGSLSNPDFKFDLELPTVKEEDRELVRSITATEEQMNTQIIYLLGIGKFYTADYAMNDQQSNATSSLAFTTLSGQINNMLSQWIDSNNWNIGANLSTGDKGWSDVEAEAVLSGRLLNNRLIVNGNFGYKDNAMLNSNFVGDFEAIWLLTRNGDIRLRAYNQTNDRYLFKSTLTTQGVGVSYKKDFDSWSDLFYQFIKKKKK